MSWNHLRGSGAVAFARGLEVRPPSMASPLGAHLPGARCPSLQLFRNEPWIFSAEHKECLCS